MQTDIYMRGKVVADKIDEVMKLRKDPDTSTDNFKNLISKLIMESFNDGILSNISTKKVISEKTLKQKSKEITGFLPAHFKNSETGISLNKLILDEVLANTTDYVLNVGYEPVLKEVIDKALQVAYSIGITTGFEIASDSGLKDIYTSNVERFMKSGIPGNN